MREILGKCAYIGEPLKVAKMNMIIHQIKRRVPNIIKEKLLRKEEYLHMILLKNVLFVGRKLNIERVEME